jgi:hypothetical protein
MISTNTLTKRQYKLVRLCRDKWYCRIHHLHFTNGEPSFRIPPRVEQRIRLGEKGKRRGADDNPFVTQKEQDLLDLIQLEEEGMILEIDVREGQPCDLKFSAEVVRD